MLRFEIDTVVVADSLLEPERLEGRVAGTVDVTGPSYAAARLASMTPIPCTSSVCSSFSSEPRERAQPRGSRLGRSARTELAERTGDLPRLANLLEDGKRLAPELV